MKKTDDFKHRASIAVKQYLLGNAGVISTIAKVSEILGRRARGGKKTRSIRQRRQRVRCSAHRCFAFDRPALPALALSVNTSCFTAIGNDYGFDLVLDPNHRS
jgi:D-sedoheptulose 7-phosphate isomerase